MTLNVGILTFHWTPHIGASLQTIALYHTLYSRFNVSIINFLPRLSILVRPTVNLGKIVEKYRGNSIRFAMRTSLGEIANYLFQFSAEQRKELNHKKILEMLKLTRPLRSLNELKEEVKHFDVIVVGSDQVWNPVFLRYSDYAYLLPFKVDGLKKVSYAASFGIDNLDTIPVKLLTIYSRCLRDFIAISVREQSHVSWVSKLISREVEHALDSTFLFDASFWKSLASIHTFSDLKDGDIVFVYNLNFETIKSIEPLLVKLDKYGFQIVAYARPQPFPFQQGFSDITYYIKLKKKLKIKFLEYIDPFEFLRLIAMSRYTITNSYHGTIFSILFEKNFITILPRGTSVRILDLLNLLGLRDRAVYDANEALKRLEEEVEYKGVREKLEFHRRRSYNFLISAIKGRIQRVS
jgi:hypothetical protein